jgi:hypothetical protein
VKLLAKIVSILLRLGLTILSLFILWKACLQFFAIAWGNGTWLGQFSPKLGPAFLIFVLICIVIFLGVVAILWLPEKIRPWLRVFIKVRERLRWGRWPLVAVILLFPMWLMQYSYWGGVFTGNYLRILLLLGMAISTGVFISNSDEKLIQMPELAAGLLLVAASFTVGASFNWVGSYPFGLSWSEGNRIWDYSVSRKRRCISVCGCWQGYGHSCS